MFTCDVMKKKFTVDPNEIGKRLDIFVLSRVENITRSQVQKGLLIGDIKVNGVEKKCAYKVREGDMIEIDTKPPRPMTSLAQDISLDIIYEDPDLIVVNKAAGMVVHPAAGNAENTLVNALLHHCKDLSGIGGLLRPGIVHRLDKGTSGVIVVAKNDKTHHSLSEQFKDRKTTKIYYALIYGSPKTSVGVFDAEIGRHPTDRKRMSTHTRHGRSAITHWEVIERFGSSISLVKIGLMTGRTHQIRVHFSAAGMPLVGDDAYGGKKTKRRLSDGRYRELIAGVNRPLLHAASITIKHPTTEKEVTFEAPIPKDFGEVLEGLREISQ